MGMQFGGDDYITKPLNMRWEDHDELVCRRDVRERGEDFRADAEERGYSARSGRGSGDLGPSENVPLFGRVVSLADRLQLSGRRGDR